ncbi:hypothetical protein PGT21_050175 [Puccinia graminis f. sp. tritici]|uniref:CCHC-type domain-containing protein n=1 Tax=Puccinia graminis f. sp. tritici TaxID=56615 RepID=A0A5B0RLT4_PUCGR|nr:hypothetical protein PGT21_050175 [Puccinia graminis f. sp. tritici]KAA1126068.1 hypothetical protein PGTUg99_050125 [Puccinia graminis f. sp. tritici]
MSTNPGSTVNTRDRRRPSLSGSITSQESFDISEDYQPDGAQLMANLFDSVAGTGPAVNPGDQTLRPAGQTSTSGTNNPLRTDRAQTAPAGDANSGNHRPADLNPPIPARLDPPPHQNPSQAAETEDERDYRLSELKLKQNKLVLSTVASIVSSMKKEDALQPDGSNFGQWICGLREISRTGLSSANFFFEPCGSKTFEKIGRAVMLASVHSSLIPDLQSIDTAHKMYLALKKKFKTVSRAAQMNIWRRLMAFRVDPSALSAGIASTLLDMYSEWKSVNVSCRGDSFLGFLLQAAVMESNAPYKADFENRIENAIQFDQNKACPTFSFICNAYDISRQQHLQSTNQIAKPVGSVFSPAALLTSTTLNDEFDASIFLTDVDESDWCDALDFFALTAAKCWSCGGDDHYQRECPQRSTLPARRNQGGSQAIGTLVGTIYGQLPSGFQVTSGRFPNYSTRKSLAPPSNNQHRAKQMADYYRPRYNQKHQSQTQRSSTTSSNKPGGVTAQIVELGVLPDDLDTLGFRTMALGEDILPTVADQRSQGSGT